MTMRDVPGQARVRVDRTALRAADPQARPGGAPLPRVVVVRRRRERAVAPDSREREKVIVDPPLLARVPEVPVLPKVRRVVRGLVADRGGSSARPAVG